MKPLDFEPHLLQGSESRRLFAGPGKARKCVNMVRHPDGGLISMRGPCLLHPIGEQSTSLGWPHGIFHYSVGDGTVTHILIRASTKLYRFAGWLNNGGDWEELASRLTDEREPRFPDQWCQLGDLVIWTNGIDRPRVILPDGRVFPLGFHEIPGAPTVAGPWQSDVDARSPGATGASGYENNDRGYSWYGRIGTTGGLLQGQSGALLRSSHRYRIVLVDPVGNVSAPSVPTEPVVLREVQADPYNRSNTSAAAVELDDLLRQFLVRHDGSLPSHVRRVIIYRTPDEINQGPEFRYLDEHTSGGEWVYPDEKSDSELGDPIIEHEPVPVFRLCCEHEGQVVVANSPDAPGRIWFMDPGFTGSIRKGNWVELTSGGQEVTAIFSHAGVLYAATEGALYAIAEGQRPKIVTPQTGVVAPSSVAPTADGGRAWLARDGFHGLTASGELVHYTAEDSELVPSDLNVSRLRTASAAYDRTHGEYRCSVARAGRPFNRLMVVIDPLGFRKFDPGIYMERVCAADSVDGGSFTLFFGVDVNDSGNKVWVMDHETPSWSYPTRTYTYETVDIPMTAMETTPSRIKGLLICLRDAWDGRADLTVWVNREELPYQTFTNALRLVGPDEVFDPDGDDGVDPLGSGPERPSSMLRDLIDVGLMGTMLPHDPRVSWRHATLDINDCTSLRFRVSCDSPKRMHLLAFAVWGMRPDGSKWIARLAEFDDTVNEVPSDLFPS